MEFTWATFGLIVLAACCGAVLLANWSKGDAWRRNKIDLVDVDVETGFARGRTWFTMFSPEATGFDVQLAADHDETATLAWLGLPGGGLGGMESAAAPPLFAEGYRFAPDEPRLEDVPVQIWSTKNFSGTWFPSQTPPLAADLRRERLGLDDIVEGTIRNESESDWSEAVLLYDRWVISLGKVPAGAAITLDERTPSVVADQFFNRRRRVGESEVVVTYDKASPDVSRIMEMVMFHEAAGGQQYTRLKHQYESRLDFSRLLSPERAILLVQTNRPAIEIEAPDIELTAENKQQWTFLRFVIPVGQ